YRVVRGELDAYGAGLEDKPEVLALSRADLVDPKAMTKLAKKLAKVAGVETFVVSAATGDGLDPLLDAILDKVGGEKEAEDADLHEREWSPL
ncbi:MAG: GTPase ObgE, partial [Pseudomonadota bacterium]|nr:GTPase ObgE [Pseudomonadota bacterium]